MGPVLAASVVLFTYGYGMLRDGPAVLYGVVDEADTVLENTELGVELEASAGNDAVTDKEADVKLKGDVSEADISGLLKDDDDNESVAEEPVPVAVNPVDIVPLNVGYGAVVEADVAEEDVKGKGAVCEIDVNDGSKVLIGVDVVTMKVPEKGAVSEINVDKDGEVVVEAELAETDVLEKEAELMREEVALIGAVADAEAPELLTVVLVVGVDGLATE